MKEDFQPTPNLAFRFVEQEGSGHEGASGSPGVAQSEVRLVAQQAKFFVTPVRFTNIFKQPGAILQLVVANAGNAQVGVFWLWIRRC